MTVTPCNCLYTRRRGSSVTKTQSAAGPASPQKILQQQNVALYHSSSINPLTTDQHH